MNEDQFIQRISEFGKLEAIVWQNKTIEYQALSEIINRWSNVILEKNIQSGECIAFCGDFSPETTALFLALIKNKNIIVPLTNTLQQKNQAWYLDVACASKVIEFDSFDSWTLRNLPQKEPHPLFQQLIDNKEAGLILFSSGSTGTPKAMLLSLRAIFSSFPDKLKPYRTITFLLLDHIGGINTLLYTLYQGGTIIVPTSRQPDSICQLIDAHRVELLPTTPTFLNMLMMSQAYKHNNLSTLKLITYGTEPMLASTLVALHQALPNVRLKQTYGMTEIGILPTISEHDTSTLIKIGGKGYETKIANGTLWVKGHLMMLGYLNFPFHLNDDRWMDTGDAVEKHGDYLQILGRKSEMINVGGEKVFPAEVENVILQAANIKGVVVKAKANPIVGHVIVAAVELSEFEDPVALSKRIRAFCKERLQPYKVPIVVTVSSGQLHNVRFKKDRRTNLT